MTQWPMERVPVSEIESFYIKGAVGAYHSQHQKELLLDEVKEPDGEALAYKYGIVGTGAGKLSIPYKFAIEHWPNCWPCPGQETGDCVGHAGKNIGLVTIGVEAVLDKPDEITNLIRYMELVRFNENLLLDLSLTIMKYKGSSIDLDIRYLFTNFDRRICIGTDHPEYTHLDVRKRFEYFGQDVAINKLENIAFLNLTKFLNI